MKAKAFLLIAGLILSGLSACLLQNPLTKKPKPKTPALSEEQAAEARLQQQSERLAAENEALKKKVGNLERRLALEAKERAAQEELLAQMREDLLAAVEEATQAKTALVNPGSQAAAIAALAEARIALDKARNHPLAGQVKNHLDSADKMVSAASRQLETGNFNGAVYFARSAQRTVEGALKLAQIEAEQAGRLLTVAGAQANLRQEPSPQSAKLAQLPPGTPVIQREKRGEWFLVYVPDTGMTGWLHVSVLK